MNATNLLHTITCIECNKNFTLKFKKYEDKIEFIKNFRAIFCGKCQFIDNNIVLSSSNDSNFISSQAA